VKEFIKDPDATLDYCISWDAWLVDGDEIIESTWFVPNEIYSTRADEFNGKKAIVWLTGGEDTAEYKVTNRIKTTEGRIDDRTFLVRIAEK
jgi:hypothetical protein